MFLLKIQKTQLSVYPWGKSHIFVITLKLQFPSPKTCDFCSDDIYSNERQAFGQDVGGLNSLKWNCIFTTMGEGNNVGISCKIEVISFHLSKVFSILIDLVHTHTDRDKQTSLLQKFVNYGHKKFYNIGPCAAKHYESVIYGKMTNSLACILNFLRS